MFKYFVSYNVAYDNSTSSYGNPLGLTVDTILTYNFFMTQAEFDDFEANPPANATNIVKEKWEFVETV